MLALHTWLLSHMCHQSQPSFGLKSLVTILEKSSFWDLCGVIFPVITLIQTSIGPRQANLVLIAYVSSEGSGEPEPPLLAHTSSDSRGTFRQKARSRAPLNDWACAVKICHDGMLENTNSLDRAHFRHKQLAGCRQYNGTRIKGEFNLT